MSAVTIDELTIPSAPGATGWDDFVEMVRVRNDIEADVVGNYDLAYEPTELLPGWLDPYEPRRLFVPRVDGRIVGRIIYESSVDTASAHIAWFVIEVAPAHRGHGIGAAGHARLLEIARSEGKRVVQAFVVQGLDDSLERIVPPTGFGSLPADSVVTRFLLARGYRLEQVVRMSRLDLPVDVEPRLADAASPGYRIVSWVGRTPEEYLAGVAELRTRMATDAPSAGTEPDLTPWTVERVRDHEATLEMSPRRTLTTLAVHEATGEPAGYTELSVPAELARPVAQGDTIVLSDHRGHGLGMLLKLANIAHLERELPGHPSITTFNAEENRHMLAVNEAIGFGPWGYEGAWRLDLD